MFAARSPVSSEAQLVLVELQHGALIDNDVVPAALSYIVGDIGRGRPMSRVAVLGLDRASRLYRGKLSGLVNPFRWGPRSDLNEIVKYVLSVWGQGSSDRVLVLDSLTTLLGAEAGVWRIVKLIRDLKAQAEDNSLTVVGSFRKNAENAVDAEPLRRLATTHVILKQNSSDEVGDSEIQEEFWDQVVFHVRRRKASGRAHLETLKTTFDPVTGALCNPIVKSDAASGNEVSSADTRAEAEDVMSKLGLTFSVSLTTKEREVRAAAGLPYVHQDERLADLALVLHPRSLRIRPGFGFTGDERDQLDSSEEDDIDELDDDENDEDLFSEDV